MSLQLYIALYPFFHKKYGQNLSIILFAFFFYLFYIPKIQYYIFIAVFYFTLYHFLSSGALFYLCLQHKKRRRMDFRVRSAALLVLENETGGVTFPHLLTMGDGCPFRPQISFFKISFCMASQFSSMPEVSLNWVRARSRLWFSRAVLK